MQSIRVDLVLSRRGAWHPGLVVRPLVSLLVTAVVLSAVIVAPGSPCQKIVDSEFAEFELRCGVEPLDWTWLQGYAQLDEGEVMPMIV